MAVLEIGGCRFVGRGCDGVQVRAVRLEWGGGDAVVGSGAEEWFEAVIEHEVDEVCRRRSPVPA